jgi:iron complex outermembrane recepter protein
MNKLTASLLFAAGASAFAQQTPGSAAETHAEEETVALSPFTVTAERDTGYVATNTEAGSRLNSRILDTPSAMSVMTSDFLRDIGAVNLNDAVGFGLNTGVNTENDDGGYQIRGIRSGAYGRNYFIRGTGDVYNIDRATFSRGPNSILFGNADPAGIINITTKQADLVKNVRNVSTRFESDGGWRVTADIGQVLVPKRLALRVDLLNQELNGFRKPARNDWQAYYLAGTAVLVDNANYQLSVRFDFEHVKQLRNYARVDVITESVSYWNSTGRAVAPNANGVTSTATTPAGAVRQGATNYLVAVDQSLQPVPLLNWRNTSRGAEDPSGILPASESLYPLYINSQGLSSSLEDNRQRFRTGYLEQRFGKNLFLQLAYNDYYQRYWRPWSNTGFTELRVDTNAQLPSLAGNSTSAGQPNPNVGKYYFEKSMRPQRYTYDESTFRASAAYELDLRERNPWLGKHRIVGSYDDRDTAYFIDNMREVNVTPLAGYSASLAATDNRVMHRSYVYPDQGIFVTGDVGLISQGPGGVNSDYVRIDTPTTVRSKADSLFGALQSFWLKNRLVTIFGVRRDHVRDPSIGPDALGVWPVASRALISPVAVDESTVTTRSLGLVLHLNSHFSLFYNNSDNFSPSATRHDVNGDMIPISVGEGQDAGLKFQFFDQKLSGTIGVYKNSKKYDAVTGIVGVSDADSAIKQIWDIMNEPTNSLRRQGGAYSDYKYTRDYEATGVEMELTYNPTRSWRISLSAAHNNTDFAQVAPALDTYVAKYLDLWRANGNLSASGTSINSVIDNQLLPAYREIKIQEGETAAFVRPWSATLVTSYSLRTGFLRGLSIGGALRFRDRMIIGYGTRPDGTLDDSIVYHGRSVYQTDAFVGYQRNLFKKKVRWTSRIGARNLFDDERPLPVRARTDGVPDRLQVQEPLTFNWSNSFDF